MTQEKALELIDSHINELVDPIQISSWTWLRAIIANFDPNEWEQALQDATETLSR